MKKGKILKTEKMRFAEDLGSWIVTVENNKVIVHALGGGVEITPEDGENIQELRDRVFNLVKGIPCGAEYVMKFLSITL